MKRVTTVLFIVFFMCGTALAHSGHDAPAPHFHAVWEVVLLVAVVAACFFIYFGKRTQSKASDVKRSCSDHSDSVAENLR